MHSTQKPLLKQFLLGTILLGLGLPSICAIADTPASAIIISTNSLPNIKLPNMWYVPHIDLGGYYAENQPKSAGSVNLFLPLLQSANQLTFTQIQTLSKSGGTWEGNASLGYRRLSQDGKTIWGLAASYNHLRGSNTLLFNQANINGLVWHNNWTANSNIYYPFGNTRQADASAQRTKLKQAGARYKEIYYTPGYQDAMRGLDLSIGNTIWKGLTLSAGGYYYTSGVDKQPDIAGPLLHADYTWYAKPGHKISGLFDRISATAQVQHDGPRGTHYYTGITFSILLPGQASNLTGVSRHMIDPINHQSLSITTQKRTASPLQLLTNADGTPVRVRTVDNKSELLDAIEHDSQANVIGVDGTISDLADVNILRSLYLTGDNFYFRAAGQNFQVKVAENGKLFAKNSHNLLLINAPTQMKGEATTSGSTSPINVTIADLELHTDTKSCNAFQPCNAVSNGNGPHGPTGEINFGTVTLKNDNIYGHVAFELNGQGLTSTVNFDHDLVDTGSWANPATRTPYAADIDLIATNGSHLTVGDFSDNTLLNSAAPSSNVAGLYNHASERGTITYLNSITDNQMGSSTSSLPGNGIKNYAQTSGSIVFNSALTNNTIFSQTSGIFNETPHASGTNSTASIIYKGAITGNNLGTAASPIGGDGIKNKAYDGQTIVFDQDISNNNIFSLATGIYNSATVAANNQFGSGGVILYQGNISKNHIESSSNGIENQAISGGKVEYNGALSDNTIFATSDGIYNTTATLLTTARSGGEVIYNAPVTGNNIGSNSRHIGGEGIKNLSTDGGRIQYNAPFSNNTIFSNGTAGIENHAYTHDGYTNGDPASIEYNAFENNVINSTSEGMRNWTDGNGSDGDSIIFGSFSGNHITGIESATNPYDPAIIDNQAKDSGEIEYSDGMKNNILINAISSNDPPAPVLGNRVYPENTNTSGSINYRGSITGNHFIFTENPSNAPHAQIGLNTLGGGTITMNGFYNNTIAGVGSGINLATDGNGNSNINITVGDGRKNLKEANTFTNSGAGVSVSGNARCEPACGATLPSYKQQYTSQLLDTLLKPNK